MTVFNSGRRQALITGLAPLIGLALPALEARAQTQYPSKPIRLYVPFAAGGGTDIIARQVASKLNETFGYTVIVENHPGAGGSLGAEKALAQPADGYTLLVIAADYMAYNKPGFDPVAAIQPVIQLVNQPGVLVVSAKSDVKTLRELIDKARKAPGSVTYGSAGVGSLGHLSTEWFASISGVKLHHIPYKGTSGVMADLAGGQIDMLFASVAGARTLIKAGKLRALAVAAPDRVTDLPDVPTFVETGSKYEGGLVWYGLVVARGVPASVVAKLNADVGSVLRKPELMAQVAASGGTPVGGTPEQLGQLIRSEQTLWQGILKEINLKPE